MQSKVTKSFWKMYKSLPKSIQDLAKSQYYTFFKINPYHPSLRFKPLKGFENIYSVRVSLGYRALGKYNKESDIIYWFWIGSHEDYNKIAK
jgi:mRNA-degrading endonuclease RelE of RelBE toxin-antitoxin system